MLGAGLVAKKACELGLQVSLILEICFSVHFCCLLDISMWSSCNQLVTWLILHQYHFVAGLFLLSYEPVTCVVVHQVKPWIKTSLAPGSGVVTKYLFQRYAARSYFTIRLFCMTVWFMIVVVSLVACNTTWISKAFTLLVMVVQLVLGILENLINLLHLQFQIMVWLMSVECWLYLLCSFSSDMSAYIVYLDFVWIGHGW